MKLKKQYCLVFSLASILSACSTATQNTDQNQSPTVVEVAKAEVLETEVVNQVQQLDQGENQALLQSVTAKDQEINQLEKIISNNQTKITDLTRQLDQQEAKISRLENAQNNTNTAKLVEIESEKQTLSELEANYINLKLENEKLNDAINSLKIQNRLYKEQIIAHNIEMENKLAAEGDNLISAEESVADVKQDLSIIGLQRDYDLLNSTHHTLLHKYSLLDADYQALDKEYLAQKKALNQLDDEHQTLKQTNQTLASNYAELRQKNLDLGGAISDARAQQQTLWDQIQVKDKVIASLEADNSALREKSSSLDKLTSGQLTTALPVADNSLELGTLNAKILVLESEISAQQKLLNEYQGKLANLEQSDDKSDLKNIEIARLGQALSDLNADHKALNYQFEQLELAQAVSREQQALLRQDLEAAQASVEELTQQKQSLTNELTLAKEELVSLQARYEESLLALESAKETRQSLEEQLSDLIELEAISAGFKSHLATNLSNVRWQIPKQVELGASFEIILTANVNDSIAGQVFIAELIGDSSLELVSSVSAEAQAADGQLQWRWRAKGVSESQVAHVNLFIHQDIQYQEDRILKEIYRDQQVLSLVNDNLLEKYGFWIIAIFAGLMGGFLIGKLNKSQPDNV
ncbi:MAG: hypothetical protein ACPGUE_08925 [Marinomonas sp.]|uniref:hypothetical protein n=1 Tax=unclassified Marinomonas TaxID=196814 RepID=UPI0007AEEE7F|nr:MULTISPECIES: hypothetical protein [unclassified Marinomonas]KZM43652.1 hypothetical protein OA92_08150 [Marinomonas sp. SBI22]KZM47214.1 hypothetical protein OA91_01530 [Marinomonas sp. SBI8L]